jgi:hypothetical protein
MKKYFQPKYYLTQAISGHNNTREYLNRFCITDTNLCLTCPSKVDNLWHRMYECNRFEEQRAILEEEVKRESFVWPLPTKELLNFLIFNYFNNFCKYVFKNNLHLL